MSRIILLLIPLIALVSGQLENTTVTAPPSNATTIAPITNATTTEPTTNTTTLAPTTLAPTTTVRPTTTPTPSPTIPPAQAPQEWKGNVTEGNNTCINVQFKVQISVKYNTTMNSTETTKFNIPTDAKVNKDKSSCSSNATQLEVIVIDFVDNFTSGILKLTFNKTNEAFVQEIELSYNLTKTQFPSYVDSKQYNQMVTVRQTDLKLFKVMEKRSYTCSDAQSAKPTQENKNLPKDADIEFTNSQVEAYIDQNKAGKFDDALDCATTNVSDVVPIAVGAALAGLVVIVLIAYFIGRRRSRRLAYQSV